MQTDPEEYRRHYASLSDDALLATDRESLADLSRLYFDAEVAARGFSYERPTLHMPEMDGPLVPAAVFFFLWEAQVARGLLQSAGVRCYLQNEYLLSIIWTWNNALGGFRLLVPVSELASVREMLNTQTETEPDEEWSGRRGVLHQGAVWKRVVGTIAFFFPFVGVDVDRLHLFYFF